MAIITQIWYFFLSLRPKQWMKNLILFIPLVFSGNLFHENMLLTSISGFLLFSLFAGSTYVLNDIRDREKDRKHPTKSLRPIASGKLHLSFALALSIILEITILYTVFSFFWKYVALLFFVYWINTFLYTFWVKHIVILDVFSIAFWFVLRGLIGVFLIHTEVSLWFLLLLFFGALWFGFLKRYQEVKLGIETRKNILAYNEDFLKQTISMITTCIIMAYSFYTFNSVQSKWMAITIPFVMFGMVRYFYHIFFLEKFSHSIEEIILKDWFILADVMLFMVSVISIIYFGKIYGA